MLAYYDNGIINLMRGDSFCTPIYINEGTKLNPVYKTLSYNDKLYFGLMEPNQAFEDAVVKKVFDYTSERDDKGNTLLILNPKDTEKLLVGKYYYMIKLRTFDVYGNEYVKTVIEPTQFFLNGNNPQPDIVERHEQGSYDIDHIVIEGGEVDVESQDTTIIVFDGGEIL
jgi:hypothetical protein